MITVIETTMKDLATKEGDLSHMEIQARLWKKRKTRGGAHEILLDSHRWNWKDIHGRTSSLSREWFHIELLCVQMTHMWAMWVSSSNVYVAIKPWVHHLSKNNCSSWVSGGSGSVWKNALEIDSARVLCVPVFIVPLKVKTGFRAAEWLLWPSARVRLFVGIWSLGSTLATSLSPPLTVSFAPNVCHRIWLMACVPAASAPHSKS